MASTYDLVEYDSDEAGETDPEGPPRANLIAAAIFISRLLRGNGIGFAVMGGFAMLCRGSSRTTTDVDVATDATMAALWRVVEVQPRRTLDGVIKVFVRTGPSHGEEYCQQERNIEVDLMTPGTKGTPVELLQHCAELPIRVFGQDIIFTGLDLHYMLRSKLYHVASRYIKRDVDDVVYLLEIYLGEISQIANHLEPDAKYAFMERSEISAEDPSVQAQYRAVLRME
ncbi:MAG: hypothetical protein Q9160_006976 [Pyrenula sp. 1 TL-2023]